VTLSLNLQDVTPELAPASKLTFRALFQVTPTEQSFIHSRDKNMFSDPCLSFDLELFICLVLFCKFCRG